MTFFPAECEVYLYDPENGLEEMGTIEEAANAAADKIQTYRDDLEWMDGVEHIAVFVKVVGVEDKSSRPEYEDWKSVAVTDIDGYDKKQERIDELESLLRRVVNGNWSITEVQEKLGDLASSM